MAGPALADDIGLAALAGCDFLKRMAPAGVFFPGFVHLAEDGGTGPVLLGGFTRTRRFFGRAALLLLETLWV
jgi:hypothetical protein